MLVPYRQAFAEVGVGAVREPMNFSFKLLAAENQPWDSLDCSSLC